MFPFAAIGAGLGQGTQMIQQQQDAYIRQLMLQQYLQQQKLGLQKDQRASDAAALALGFGTGGDIKPLGQGGPGGMSGLSMLPGGLNAAPQPSPGPRGGDAFGNALTGALGAVGQRPPIRDPGLAQLAQMQPGLTQPAQPAGQLPWTATPPPPISAEMGPGAGGMPTAPMAAADIPPPAGGGGPNVPQMTQAQPDASALMGPISGASAPAFNPADPPPAMPRSPQQIMQELRQQHPGTNPRTIMEAVPTLLKQEQEVYKNQFEAWKARNQFAGQAESRGLTAAGQAETAYANRMRERPETMKEEGAATSWQSVLGDIFPEAKKQAEAGSAALNVDPMVRGRMNMNALAQQIEKAMPGASSAAKMMALEQRMKLLAPEEQARLRGELDAAKGAARAGMTRRNIRVTDDEGKVVFQGSATPLPDAQGGGWKADATGQPIQVPDGATLTITGQGDPGKQAAAQNQRVVNAANEFAAAINNLGNLTHDVTTGWFQGIQAEKGKTLTDGIRRTLANKVTPEDAQIVSVLSKGIGRSLASLSTAGAATGLVSLQQSLESLAQFQEGDTVFTMLTKLAEMRQVAERAIEASHASPTIGAEQKKLLGKIDGEVKQAVPFTVLDVIRLRRQPGEQTFQDFARSIGLGGRAAAAGAPIPNAGDIEMLKANPDKRDMFDAVFGPGAAAKALGGQ